MKRQGSSLQQTKVSPPKQDSGTSMPMPGATQKDTRSNLRVVRRILSQWNKNVEKPFEGYNNNPKPVTPKPGAAQIWLASLKTKGGR